MSIVTLKRKTQTKYNNMSVNVPNFALNGTRRSQGYIGQSTQSRFLSRTLFNGATPRGHGGCCGTYPQQYIVQSAVTSLNDPDVIKLSTLSAKGRIETELMCCTPVVKPDNTLNMNTSQEHTKSVAKCSINQSLSVESGPRVSSCTNYDSYYKKSICNNSKPTSDYVPISSSEYIAGGVSTKQAKDKNECINNDTVNVQKPSSSGILPGSAKKW
jgi:hypothetical protein